MGDDDTIELLRQAADGDLEAREEAWARLYEEVVRVAAAQRNRWRGDWTLETRVLASEVFIKLYGNSPVSLNDRQHFFKLLARAIRQILASYAAMRQTSKRGGGQPVETLEEELAIDLDPVAAEQIVDLTEALERLARLDPRAASVVDLRFFVGLTYDEIADTLEVSRATAVRDWDFARAWLHRELSAATTSVLGDRDPDGGASDDG